jgi:predicted nucleotidyltransferase
LEKKIMTCARREILRRGRNMGALYAAVLSFTLGIIPAFYFGGYGALILLSKFSPPPVEPVFTVRFLITLGALIGLVIISIIVIGTGALAGTVLAYISNFAQFRRSMVDSVPIHEQVIRFHRKISLEKRETLLTSLSFLTPFSDMFHSTILVGSAAYDLDGPDSDLDIVIIGKEHGYKFLHDFLFDKGIEDQIHGREQMKCEYTILKPSEVEKQFRLASPFAHSIRHGVVLKDDGYLKDLIRTDCPLTPGRSYILATLYDGIAVQYYGSISALEKEMRKHHSSDGSCTKRRKCLGHSPAATLAKVIVRMLYIALPFRGYMPLTKKDLIDFARQEYGDSSRGITEQAVRMIRNNISSISYNDYRIFKPFAVQLFREILNHTGFRKDVSALLRNAAFTVLGEYEKINDAQYRKCVIM